MNGLPLSVLDLVPVVQGGSAGQAVRDSVALATRLDALGYTRLWYAEHHNMPMIAATNPALMIALSAQATTRIRVGAGGVMLPNHASLQVAEAYKWLEAVYPGRIDLGIGRAPGTDPMTAFALRRARELMDADDFPQQLAELMAFGGATFPAAHRFFKVKAQPEDAPLPPIYLLGSSGYSAQLSAMLGLGFGYAAHFSPTAPEGPMLAYREAYLAAGNPRPPHAILALAVICAETTEAAERLALPMQLAWVRLRTGRLGRLPSYEEAAAHVYTPDEQAVVALYRQLQIIGDPPTVKARIAARAASTQADEVMISTITADPGSRRRSYELVADAFGLAA
jgi:luciferase family oxidoreductase group 1